MHSLTLALCLGRLLYLVISFGFGYPSTLLYMVGRALMFLMYHLVKVVYVLLTQISSLGLGMTKFAKSSLFSHLVFEALMQFVLFLGMMEG